MISVENSYDKRILINSKNGKAICLKEKVEKIIKEVEEDGTFDYNQLYNLRREPYSKNLSVFAYREMILIEISKLKATTITKSLAKDLDDIEKHIFLILIGRFDKMKEYVIKKRKSDLIFTGEKGERKPKNFTVYKEIFEKLYKDKLSGHSFKVSFFDLFEEINVCPYCNRNFINPIYKSSKINLDNLNQSPDIEHFFPKSMYPFLSLSISNLLPSCAFCNKIKSNFNTMNRCISPYEITQDFKFKFEIDPKNINKYNISLETQSNNSKILNLENLYKDTHSKYINEIYIDVVSHPNVFTNSLENMLNQMESKTPDPVNFKIEEWYKSFFRNYYEEDDFNKHPLSKLTKDFYNHLKDKK